MEIEEGEKEGEGERELDAERKKNEELTTRLKYMQADLENYRKRMDKEMKEAGDASVKALVSRLFVVLDELALAVRHADDLGEDKELWHGVRMVWKNMETALETVGVEKIDSVGKPFDPRVHEAVEKVQGEGDGQYVVIEELRPGYTFRGQVLRPSMVKVQLASDFEESEDE